MTLHYLGRLLSCLLLLLVVNKTFGQQAFQRKTTLINVGPVLFGRSTDFAASAEYGVSDQIGVGLRATSGYLTSRSVYSGISTGAFVNYHLFKSQRIDPFLGVAVSKTNYKASREAPGSDNYGGLHMLVHGGGRYLLTDRIGVYLEGALPLYRGVMATAELGLSLKVGR